MCWFAMVCLVSHAALGTQANSGEPPRPIPVIFDTDIGADIDDTWALALILASPELDLKLVVTDSHDVERKARIAAKFLQAAGRADVPIGIGRPMDTATDPQFAWAADYTLESYPGQVHRDGVGAMVDFIMKSPDPTTLVVVGPAPNIEEALRREPRIAKRARVVAMSGSVYRGYGGKGAPDPEYNVKDHVSSTAAMYAAGWDVLIAPLDTAGLVRLEGESYRQVLESKLPAARALIENYRVWQANGRVKVDPNQASSTLFDCVAVLLAFRTDLCDIEGLKLKVTPDGFTRPDPDGSPVRAAVRWKNIAAFEKLLAQRLAADQR